MGFMHKGLWLKFSEIVLDSNHNPNFKKIYLRPIKKESNIGRFVLEPRFYYVILFILSNFNNVKKALLYLLVYTLRGLTKETVRQELLIHSEKGCFALNNFPLFLKEPFLLGPSVQTLSSR